MVDEADYDVAISFAGEDRTLAEQLAALLAAEGVAVFYDAWELATLWGKDLYRYLDTIYRARSRYCVVLISAAYARKAWTSHELRSAQARAFKNDDYLLPVRIDDTEVPGLPATVGFLDARKLSLDEIAQLLLLKLARKDIRSNTRAPGDTLPMASFDAGEPPAVAGAPTQMFKVDTPCVWVPAGCFTMGWGSDESEEGPEHEVTIGRGFWISRSPVTVAAYKEFLIATSGQLPEPVPWNHIWSKEDHPIVNVSWKDAMAYCRWVGGRLPTEAEWEYAARGNRSPRSRYPWGDHAQPPTKRPAQMTTLPVGQGEPNGFGLLDLTFLSEWCQDQWHRSYRGAPLDGTAWMTGGGWESWLLTLRVGRCDGVVRDWMSLSRRCAYNGSYGHGLLGFRCVYDDARQ